MIRRWSMTCDCTYLQSFYYSGFQPIVLHSWHQNVACPSMTMCIMATAKVSEQVNRKCPPTATLYIAVGKCYCIDDVHFCSSWMAV